MHKKASFIWPCVRHRVDDTSATIMTRRARFACTLAILGLAPNACVSKGDTLIDTHGPSSGGLGWR